MRAAEVGAERRAVSAEVAPDLELREVSKRFGQAGQGTLAVDSFSLQVQAGELVALLGPSGCGKTTTLRMIAGFVPPDAGQVLIKGRDVTDLPPNRRDTGMVFQSYALFPHMTVEENVGYGLKVRRVPPEERRRRVAEALELVRLPELARRYPRQLSGGQQQRVALARAIVIRPSALLLDEPLSNLDAKLRQQMRAEIRDLQRQLRMTTVFVTHDQEEALTMSDRIVVMNQGRVEQVGSPRAVYTSPRTLFVARFIGEGNFFEGTVGPRAAQGTAFTTREGLRLLIESADGYAEGQEAVVALRSETVAVLPPGDPLGERFANRFEGVVQEVTYLGASTALAVRLGERLLVRAVRQNQDTDGVADLTPGAKVQVVWQPASCRMVETR